MIARTACISLIACALLCAAAPAHADRFSVTVQPSLLHGMLRSAGIASEVHPESHGTDYGNCLFFDDFRGATVLICLSTGGLQENEPFLLSIDDRPATVMLNDSGRLQILSGDESIADYGLFGTLECIFNNILTMLSLFFDAILSLNIFAAIEAIVGGILGIFICIIF